MQIFLSNTLKTNMISTFYSFRKFVINTYDFVLNRSEL